MDKTLAQLIADISQAIHPVLEGSELVDTVEIVLMKQGKELATVEFGTDEEELAKKPGHLYTPPMKQ
jgi:hypothetical protein